MAPFPKRFSIASHGIEVAISDGRAEEAMHKLVRALRTTDDAAVRLLAADWIEAVGLPPGKAKALRKNRKSLPSEWLDISEMVRRLQGDGHSYEKATKEAAAHFGYSDRHVQTCVHMWNEAEQAARESE